MELQNTLRSYLSSFETYSYVRDIKLRVLYGDKMHIKIVQQSLATFLVDQNESPILRLLALKFNKELAETFNEDYIHLMQKIILPKMEQIALFKKEQQDSDRGKLFFLGQQKPHQGNKELQALGDQFFRVTLECIRIWGRWFPLDKQHHRLSLYRVAYERLYKIGVNFPEIQYFDLHQVHTNLPSTFPPFSMMLQLKRVMNLHLNSTTKEICRYLESHLPEEFNQTQYQSFAELFQTIVKKHIINKNKQARIAKIFLVKEQKNNESKKQESSNEQTQLQRLQIENQQLLCLNQLYQQKMQEFQQQIIRTQNQNSLLLQQLKDKDFLIQKLETDWKKIEAKFVSLIEEYKKIHDSKNPYILAQFEKNLAEFKIEFGLTYRDLDCFKLIAENQYLIKQLDEQEDLYYKIKHEKEVLLTENKLLITKLSNLSKKESEQPQDIEEFKLYKQKSNLVQYEQTMISQKRQIIQLKDQLIQLSDKKNSVTSQTWGISTKSNSRRNINEIQACNIQQQQKLSEIQKSSYRQSKIIMPPIIDYDGTIFAINPIIFNTRFRQACFTSKSIIYQDDQIQINTFTQLKITILFITLTITNKSSIQLKDLSLKLHSTEQLEVQILNNLNQIMNPQESQIIQIQIEIKEIPYSILEASLIYFDKTILFGIPCTINKFMTFNSCKQLPKSYFYQSKPFLTGFQNSIPNLLSEFEIITQSENEVSISTSAEYQNEEYEIMISCRKSMMQIKMNGGYNDKLVKTIISTYQGLFFKR